jgi:hypothetical protein
MSFTSKRGFMNIYLATKATGRPNKVKTQFRHTLREKKKNV